MLPTTTQPPKALSNILNMSMNSFEVQLGQNSRSNAPVGSLPSRSTSCDTGPVQHEHTTCRSLRWCESLLHCSALDGPIELPHPYGAPATLATSRVEKGYECIADQLIHQSKSQHELVYKHCPPALMSLPMVFTTMTTTNKQQ
jgi:hypothetical protein